MRNPWHPNQNFSAFKSGSERLNARTAPIIPQQRSYQEQLPPLPPPRGQNPLLSWAGRHERSLGAEPGAAETGRCIKTVPAERLFSLVPTPEGPRFFRLKLGRWGGGPKWGSRFRKEPPPPKHCPVVIRPPSGASLSDYKNSCDRPPFPWFRCDLCQRATLELGPGGLAPRHRLAQVI